MSEKTEWELVDAPKTTNQNKHFHRGAQDESSQQHDPSPAHFLQALLGRWWQLKLLGAGMVAVIGFTLLLMLGGVLILTLSLAAVVSLAIARLISWVRGKQLGRNTQLSPLTRHPWQ